MGSRVQHVSSWQLDQMARFNARCSTNFPCFFVWRMPLDETKKVGGCMFGVSVCLRLPWDASHEFGPTRLAVNSLGFLI